MGVYIVELEKPLPFTDECRMSVLNTIKRYGYEPRNFFAVYKLM